MPKRSVPTEPPKGFDFSRARTIYRYGFRTVYKIRDEFILKRVAYNVESPNAEVATHEFISDNTGVPVPFVYAEWLSPDRQYHNILEGCIQGQTLGDAWPNLTWPQKKKIASQVVAHMTTLSRFTSSRMQSVSRQPLPNNIFVPKPLNPRLSGRWRTDSEIFTHEFEPALVHAGIPDALITLLRRTMPPCEGRFVLTHGDLYVGNVMVDPATAEVTALIDWESAGYWPAWFQFARITNGVTEDDGEWKWMLSTMQRKEIRHADHGRVWWRAVQELLYNPGGGRGPEWVKLLVRYLRGERVDLRGFQDEERPRLGEAEMRRNGRLGTGTADYYSTVIGPMRNFGPKLR